MYNQLMDCVSSANDVSSFPVFNDKKVIPECFCGFILIILSAAFIIANRSSTTTFLLHIIVTYQSEFGMDVAPNLTAITWSHAVNSLSLLTLALSSDVRMIEADILLGTLDSGDGGILPIMAHPPHTRSDLSLETFLRLILAHNNGHPDNVKGVKLDFKSIESFDGSLDLLKSIWHLMTYPVWINADILAGPLNNVNTKPVNASGFLQGCKHLPRSTLSLGWTTLWGPLFRDGKYTPEQINQMIDAINQNGANSIDHPITFPVRAGIAADSEDTLTDLLLRVNQNRTDTNFATLTIWSSPDDYVNVPLLRHMIVSIGYDRIYLDVPEDLKSQLKL